MAIEILIVLAYNEEKRLMTVFFGDNKKRRNERWLN